MSKTNSKYQSKGKSKWVYSTTYQLWKEAAKTEGAGSQKALALACEHARKHQFKNAACVQK